jgi:hypothetical protein
MRETKIGVLVENRATMLITKRDQPGSRERVEHVRRERINGYDIGQRQIGQVMVVGLQEGS